MEINPGTTTTRTRKVRTAKALEPKTSEMATAKPKRKPRAKAIGDLQQQIAMAAYFLAEQRHFAPGSELQDWLTAERWIHSQVGTNSN